MHDWCGSGARTVLCSLKLWCLGTATASSCRVCACVALCCGFLVVFCVGFSGSRLLVCVAIVCLRLRFVLFLAVSWCCCVGL